MSKVIYKYKLDSGRQVLKLPKDSKIMSVREQGPFVCLWALVDDEVKEYEYKNFRVLATGETFKEFDGTFLGTVVLFYSNLVFHVFVED